MKKPARVGSAPVDKKKPLVRPDLIAKALQETSQKPRQQSTGGLFAIRLFGRDGWSGPRRFPDGTPIH
jgi:hypothetical protein